MPLGTMPGWSNETLAGGAAAIVNILLTYPIYKTMFRQQVYGSSFLQTIRAISAEGTSNLYRGLAAPLVQKTSSVAMMFGLFASAYSAAWQHIGSPGSNPQYNLLAHNDTLSVVCAGLLTGSCEAVLFTPLERVQALLQSKEYHSRFSGSFASTFVTVRSFGVCEYYRGVSPILLRNGAIAELPCSLIGLGPQTAFFFLVKPHVTASVSNFAPDKQSLLSELAVNFFTGAAIGACGSSCFYPLGVVKARMQCTLGGEHASIYTMMRGLTVRELYSGVSTNLLRAVASWGVINASYECFLKVLE